MTRGLVGVLALSAVGLMSSAPATAQGAGDCEPGQVSCPGDVGPGAGGPSELSIVAQENLWFTEPRRGGINYIVDGQMILPFEPLLGLTASADEAAKMQEMQWFFRYTGQTSRNAVFSVEWLAPRDLVDRNLRKTFSALDRTDGSTLEHFLRPGARLGLARLGTGAGGFFSTRRFARCFRAISSTCEILYFNHPNYWKVRGKARAARVGGQRAGSQCR